MSRVLVWSWTTKLSHMKLHSWNVCFLGVSGRGNDDLKRKDSYAGVIFFLSFCLVQFFILSTAIMLYLLE